jgi:hypothetical protein
MKIAILGTFHFECTGFLLESCKDYNIDLYIKKNSDNHEWLKYFKSIYKFNLFLDEFTLEIIDKYKKIFKISSNDKCLDHRKIVSILHLDGPDQRKCKSDKFISLSPYIKGKNIYYTFPIFSPNLSNQEIKKNVIMIGYYTNDSFDSDTINFIKNNNNYHFYFVIWGSSYPNLQNIENVTLRHNLKTHDMINLLINSKFILSKKVINYDRFSGQLSLAMSFEKPLLIDKKTKDAYNLPGITFNNNYTELGSLDNINNEQYISLKNEIKILKNKIIKNNKIIFSKF